MYLTDFEVIAVGTVVVLALALMVMALGGHPFTAMPLMWAWPIMPALFW